MHFRLYIFSRTIILELVFNRLINMTVGYLPYSKAIQCSKIDLPETKWKVKKIGKNTDGVHLTLRSQRGLKFMDARCAIFVVIKNTTAPNLWGPLILNYKKFILFISSCVVIHYSVLVHLRLRALEYYKQIHKFLEDFAQGRTLPNSVFCYIYTGCFRIRLHTN